MATVLLNRQFMNDLRQLLLENEEVPVAAHLLGFLDKYPGGAGIIDGKSFRRMRDAEDMLEALKGAGVDNWVGYEDALEDYWGNKEEGDALA